LSPNVKGSGWAGMPIPDSFATYFIILNKATRIPYPETNEKFWI